MSLFRDIGRKAERFKQSATERAREVAEPDYRCRDCEASIDGDATECPECGSGALEAVGAAPDTAPEGEEPPSEE